VNVGSLFSGIGGFDLGLERAGMHVVWQCETDAYCRRVLAQHWPEVPCHGDVREITEVEPVDVLCGGFPCQDISVAGKGVRAGINGARSGLWSEFARLVGELRPRYVLVENVPTLRSRGLGRVLGDLAALGYDAEWDCLPASAFGAPHQRDRLWIVAYPERARPSQPGSEPQPEGALVRALDAGGEARPGDAGAWATEPSVGRVAHGVSGRVDQFRALGNALIPQIAEWIGRRILDYERGAA
jgi:DNA (cytosine-5)-methyltransferase 1